MSKAKEVRDEIAKFVGLFIIGALGIGVVVGAVYFILGTFTDDGRHWLATAFVFGMFGAYALGLHYGKAHRAGVERGLDTKLTAMERARQIGKPIIPQPTTAARFDNLLPNVQQGAVIHAVRDDSQQTIDM